MMAVFKQHQRQGIGELLMRWGLHLADELQALVRKYAKIGPISYLSRYAVHCRSNTGGAESVSKR